MSIFPTKILLVTDDSQDEQLARTTAMDMATTTDSELHVLCVTSGLPPLRRLPLPRHQDPGGGRATAQASRDNPR